MTRRRITASASARAIACGYWLDEAVALPVEEDLAGVPDDELDELELARREGDKLHALLEADDGTSNDSRVLAARAYLAEHCPQGHVREQAYGFDGERARFLGIGREVYAAYPECTVTGTADIVADLGGGRWLVSDWKSGEHGARHAGAQLRTLGALVLATFGGTAAILHAVHLEADQPARVFDHGTIDAMDGAGLLYELHTRAPGPPVPGDHCGFAYCPLRGRCPAFVEASAKMRPAELPIDALVLPGKRTKPETLAVWREEARAVVAAAELRNPFIEGIVDDETARVFAAILPLATKRFEALEKDLRAHVAKLPDKKLDMGDGYVFGPWPANFVDGPKALALATSIGIPPEDIAKFVETKTTTAIDGRGVLELAEKLGAPLADVAECMIHKRDYTWATRKKKAAS